MRRLMALAFIAGLLISGCGGLKRAETGPETPKDPPTAPPMTAPASGPAPAGLSGSDLLPLPNTRYGYMVTDGPAEEWYVRDGNRLIGSYNGTPYVTWFTSQFSDGLGHRAEVINVPGMDRPAIVYEYGKSGTFHTISFRWYHDGRAVEAWGWHPKTTTAFGAGWRVERDGTIAIWANPADIGGYSWVRRFRVERTDAEPAFYSARLIGQDLAPGAYPAEPADLMTAIFMARWFGQTSDLERYLPDVTVRSAFLAQQVETPRYVPRQVQLGRLSFMPNPQQSDPIPELTPAPLSPAGATEFLVWVYGYEGGTYYAGPVTFGRELDGSWVVRQFEMKRTGWVY